MRLSSKATTLIAAVLAVWISVFSASCGIMLHPHRAQETRSDKLDGVAILLDCAWLLVGILPGIVALAIDFVTGGAFFSKEELAVAPGGTVALDLPGPVPADCEVSLRLTGPDGRDLAPRASARARQGEPLPCGLRLAVPEIRDSRGARLVLAVDGREQASWIVRARPRAGGAL